jgi:hypothetical protein
LVWIYSRSPVGNSKGSNKGLYHKCWFFSEAIR